MIESIRCRCSIDCTRLRGASALYLGLPSSSKPSGMVSIFQKGVDEVYNIIYKKFSYLLS